MPEETTSTLETPVTPAPETAVLGRDGQPFDPQRAMATINKLREVEKEGRARDLAQTSAIRALVSARPLTAIEKATIDAATPAADSETDHLKAAFTDLSSALGVDWTGDPAPLLAAAKASRLSGQLTSALVEAGVADLPLARSAVNLEGVDPTSANLSADLKELVGHFLQDHPSMKKTMAASVSGTPHLSGAAGGPQFVTRDQMQFMSPEAINDARRAGLIEGFGPDRK